MNKGRNKNHCCYWLLYYGINFYNRPERLLQFKADDVVEYFSDGRILHNNGFYCRLGGGFCCYA